MHGKKPAVSITMTYASTVSVNEVTFTSMHERAGRPSKNVHTSRHYLEVFFDNDCGYGEIRNSIG